MTESGHPAAKCESRDSNPDGGCPLDPKSSASANSATLASLCTNNLRRLGGCHSLGCDEIATDFPPSSLEILPGDPASGHQPPGTTSRQLAGYTLSGFVRATSGLSWDPPEAVYVHVFVFPALYVKGMGLDFRKPTATHANVIEEVSLGQAGGFHAVVNTLPRVNPARIRTIRFAAPSRPRLPEICARLTCGRVSAIGYNHWQPLGRSNCVFKQRVFQC